MIFHKEMKESGRWNEFSFVEQMANIGSEIERTIKWKNVGDLEISRNAFFRALELIDFTIEDKKNRGRRLREVVFTREALVDHFVYDNVYNSTDEQWKKYFMGLSWLAAIRRGR